MAEVPAPLAVPGSPPPDGGGRRRAGRPRNHDSDETRRLLLEVALDAFAEHGFDGVSTRNLARLAQVTPTTLFHHFATKDELYGAAYHHAVGLAYAHYRRAIVGQTTLVGELRQLFAAADAILAQRPAIALLSVRVQIDQQRPGLHVAHRPEAAVTFRQEMVQRAVARGELEAADGVHVQRLLDVFLWGLSVIGYDDAQVRGESLRAIERFVEAVGPGSGTTKMQNGWPVGSAKA
ncbi:MAG: TetR/AcrR family transcriptional regulator [Acidimicrobiales bacterium]